MAEILKHTETLRAEMRKRGKESMYFFAKSICGMPDLDEKPHLKICEALDGRGDWKGWKRGLVTTARGHLKSSICTIAWPLREALYNWNWSCRILGSSHDNARTNFFRKIQAIIQTGPQRNLVFWLYGDTGWRDPETGLPGEFDRIPAELIGSTDSEIVLNRTDPFAPPAITYRGVGSLQEGYHGNAIIIDDPEGAESQTSEAARITAEEAVFSLAPPLLINPTKDRILVVATPHGQEPLVYKILEGKNGRWEKDNRKRSWKYIYIPAVDEKGDPNWPGRFTPEAIKLIRDTVSQQTWDQQYLLKKTTTGGSVFNYAKIESGFYRWKVPGREVQYSAILWDREAWEKQGLYKTELELRTGDVREMRFYGHVDFTHKADSIGIYNRKNRPSKAAIVVVGVLPDGHAFVLGTWTAKVEPEEQFRMVYWFDKRFGFHQVTFDAIGAQVWFKDYAASLERTSPAYRSYKTTGQYGPIRTVSRLTSRLVEDKRTTQEAKDAVIVDRLRPRFSDGSLHLHEDHHELLYQFRGFPDDTQFVDICDALAKGPIVWKAPISVDPKKVGRWSSLSDADAFRQVADKYTGYSCPWREPRRKPMFPDEPDDAWDDVQGPLRMSVPPGPAILDNIRGA